MDKSESNKHVQKAQSVTGLFLFWSRTLPSLMPQGFKGLVWVTWGSDIFYSPAKKFVIFSTLDILPSTLDTLPSTLDVLPLTHYKQLDKELHSIIQ